MPLSLVGTSHHAKPHLLASSENSISGYGPDFIAKVRVRQNDTTSEWHLLSVWSFPWATPTKISQVKLKNLMRSAHQVMIEK